MEGHSVIQPPSKFPTIRWVLVTLFIVGQHHCSVKCLSLQIFLLQITRQEVNHFSSGKNIPKCELLLVLDQDTPPAPLHHLFDLVGAGVRSYFLLHINPGKYYNGHSDKFTDTVLAAGSCCSEVLPSCIYIYAYMDTLINSTPLASLMHIQKCVSSCKIVAMVA